MLFPFADHLIKPVFLHLLSASLHLVLLLVFIGLWIGNKIAQVSKDGSKWKYISNLLMRTLFSTIGALVCNLAISQMYYYFFWYKNGWLDELSVTLLDLALKIVAWSVSWAFMHTSFFSSSSMKFLFFIRTWCAISLFISCYCFLLDIFLHRKDIQLTTQYLISDAVSLIVSLFICYLGFSEKNEGANVILLEPLLKDNKKTKGEETVTPYSNAGIFSILTFSWVGPLIDTGRKKTLDLEDVPQLASCDSIGEAYPAFRNKLESDCGTIKRLTTLKLVKSLIHLSWKEIIVTAILALLKTLASYVGPFLIDPFVQNLNGKETFKNEGCLLVVSFFVAKLIECLSQRQRNFRLQQVGVRIRALLMTIIYSKCLTLSSQSRQGHTAGEMINLIAVDAERVGEFCQNIHHFWMVVLQIVLALFILYKNLGMASISAFVATIILMLTNIPLGSLQKRFRGNLMGSKDRRMKATSEILKNMRILKLMGWEMKFLSKVIELRKNEESWLRKYVSITAIIVLFFHAAPTFVSVITFSTCALRGITLESGKILSSLATFRILQKSIYSLPDTMSMIVQAKISLDRIASFCCLDDLQSDAVEKLPKGSSDIAIEVINGSFSWDLSSPNMTLENIDLRIFKGTRVAICGNVGSGKSSLLSSFLGEVPKKSGILRMCGTKAFVSQSPWIQSGKIEENILFGKDMDRKIYDEVLDACCLKKDLEIFPFGDQTIIGERGINLSGGQKQRIQIARALYQDSDIYLFDEPFSAVDAHTGSHLFKECILGFLSSKTVIYVTHQVEFLPAADLILVMKDGKITQCGKYNDLLNSGIDFIKLVGAHRKALSALDSLNGGEVSDEVCISQEVSISGSKIKKEKEVNKCTQNGKKCDVVEPKGQLVQEEEREKGKVGLSVYWKFITTAYGGALVPCLLLVQILFQFFQIGSNYWMAWATPVSSDVKPIVTAYTIITTYAAISIGSSLFILARVILLAVVSYKTATVLFSKMHMCIFRAPMSFFDATPSGRIITRASTDQTAVDLSITYLVWPFAYTVIELLGNIAVMSQAAWQVFIIFIPVISVSIWYQQYYISAARELSRLVGVCKAPIIQHFAETISGSTTIRSFDQKSRFSKTIMRLLDKYSRPVFNNAGAMEWLCFRLDMLSSITFAFSLICLLFMPNGAIYPGIAGLFVTYGLSLNSLQASLIAILCKMENKIISVERIFQYSCIPCEPPLEIENRPNSSWPSHGEVDICDLQVRYAPHLPLVLHGVTCKFRGGQKTGIVGRTGSGKTTLVQTLFRIIEPTAGKIMIDGINISSLGLHDLRSRLSIIPQDPTMFEGTIRSNLDPLEEYNDEQIWEALDMCQLGDIVRMKEGMLDSVVSENGENWSMGQRQLVCLGRVLLKRSKVLVLDEATASVDTATDNLIQQTLKQHFSDCTVITIAHRITSVLDSEMVLLLNEGVVDEYDSPTRLLEMKSSFAQLVAEYTMRSKSSLD